MIKRSVSIKGHPTSLALEPEFWEALKVAASRRKISVPALIGRIDEARGASNLSSALRVFLLNEAQAQ
ncbi:MAG: ribbon-helix-helix domain-containing protein [Alphaproteobacteria bacterium]|nr:ribbon-helix-helix domain-containing protein [Alphaproteobacteria bacterium]